MYKGPHAKGLAGKVRKNLPGYSLSTDSLGRKTWRKDKSSKKGVAGKHLAGAQNLHKVISIDHKSNGVVSGINKYSVTVMDHKHNHAFIMKKPDDTAVPFASSPKSGASINPKKRVAGTNMTVAEVSKNYDDLPFKIGATVSNELGHKFSVVGITSKHVLVMNAAGELSAIAHEGSKLKTVQESNDVNSHKIMKDAITQYAKKANRKFNFGHGSLSGIVMFLNTLKELVGLKSGKSAGLGSGGGNIYGTQGKTASSAGDQWGKGTPHHMSGIDPGFHNAV